MSTSMIDGHIDPGKKDGDLISRSALLAEFGEEPLSWFDDDWEVQHRADWRKYTAAVRNAPAVDAVEVEALKAWLYGIAMNNTENYLCNACEEIISRLDGLRLFARERRDGE